MAELATIQPGATPFRIEDNVNSTWYGVVRLRDKTMLNAVIKDVGPKEMASELIASTILHALGLRTPKVYLAYARADIFFAEKGPRVAGGRVVLAFERKGDPPLGQNWKATFFPPTVFERIFQNSNFGGTFAFDTWVANIDRHIFNLLLSDDGGIHLIDHGHCFGGPSWSIESLVPSADYPNRMAHWLLRRLDRKQHKTFSEAILVLSKLADKVDLDSAAADAAAEAFLTDAEFQAMIRFLNERRIGLIPLATKQAGAPKLL